MKKLKIVSLLLVFATLALSLSSCFRLEEAKAEYAVWCDDTRTSLEYCSNKYIRLEFDDKDSKIPGYFSYSYDSVYVCEPDVPLLLRHEFGKDCMITQDKKIIQVGNYFGEDAWDAILEGYFYYCIESEYESISKSLKSFALDNYAIIIYRSGSESFVTVSEEYTEVINKIFDNIEPVTDAPNGMRADYVVKWMTFEACDAQRWFFESREVFFTQEGVYLVKYTDGESFFYKVPAVYEDLFERFYQDYCEYIEYS